MDSFVTNNHSLIQRTLEELDSFAHENVASGHGGPFAARLALFSLDRKEQCVPQVIFPLSGNMVLDTGIASFHAEAQALSSGQIAILKQKIRELAFDKHLTPIVVLFSSAQPCMACLTKIEICARHLVHENLIAPKNFFLVYGANYDATEKVAGFHDYAYALDFFNFKNNQQTKYNLIKLSLATIEETPDEISSILHENALIEAVLVRDNKVLSLGYDQRAENDYFRTSECVALHAASRSLKKQGDATPWSLSGSCLYTLNADIGPLSYAECQWANVSQIVSLTSGTAPVANPKHLDCPNCTNSLLFQRISEGTPLGQ